MRSLASNARVILASGWFRVGGTLVGLGLVVKTVNGPQALRALSHLQWGWACLGLALSGVAMLSAVGQWSTILRGTGHQVSWLRLQRVYVEGLFIGQVLPSAIGGDAMRAMEVSRHTGKHTAFASLTGSRLAGTLGMALWGLAGAIAVHEWVGVPGLIIASGFLGCMLSLWAVALSADALVRRLAGHGALRTRLHDWISPFTGILSGYRRVPAVLVRSVVIGCAGWGVNLVALSVFARALGFHADWSVFAIAIPVTLAATLSPISVNGIGVREGVLVGLLAHSGINPGDGGALSVIVDLQMLPFVVLGAALWLRRRRSRSGSFPAIPVNAVAGVQQHPAEA